MAISFDEFSPANYYLEMKLFLLILFSWSSLAFSQETLDVRFLGTQRTSGAPFSLPISVDGAGRISLFGDNTTQTLSFNPTMQIGINYAHIEYSRPVILNRFNFYPVQKEIGWIEVKRQRLEIGLGLSSIIRTVLAVGLTPYKGSMQTIVRYKKNKKEKSLPFKMPKTLSDMNRWNEGDFGTFQTYGGIVLQAGVSAGIFDIANVAVGIQNQFLIEVNKLEDEYIKLKISEENLKNRRLRLGPFASTLTNSFFEGKRLSVEFILDPRDPLHHELFKKALKGELETLQESLTHSQQKLNWEGREMEFYFGIPSVAGKINSNGHYNLNEDGVETELDIKGATNKGYLTPLRNHQQFVYQTEKGMVLVWSSEMNKVDEKAIERNFLSKGRIIGIKGFDRDLPDHKKFGSVVSQIGIHVSRSEIEALKTVDLNKVRVLLKEKCLLEKLTCRKDKKITKILNKFNKLVQLPWTEMKGDMGKLLMKEPALIYSIVKSMRYQKEVYFKFLSEKYQSLEGSSPIEI